ncbi:bifunctional 4-hydroxy-2-oxoglutarate aldolase/2-dehydro-3-deoxy-phosphogluconate aldolase [Saccharopolyspora sp. NPDC000995]
MIVGFFDEHVTGPVMAILRGMDPQRTVELAERAWDLGIEAVELPIETQHAEPSLRAAVQAGAWRGRPVGAAGGGRDRGEHGAGAHGQGTGRGVHPGAGLDPEVVRLSVELGVPHLPGVATPSEIQQAHPARAVVGQGVPGHRTGRRLVQGDTRPVPRPADGGNRRDERAQRPEFLAAGAAVVAVGSALEGPEQLPELAKLSRRPR